MPKLMSLLRIAVLPALVALAAPATTAAETVVDALFPSAITLTGVFKVLSLAPADAPLFAARNTTADDTLLASSSNWPQQGVFRSARAAREEATSGEISLSGPLRIDNFIVRSGMSNSDGSQAPWSAPSPSGFGWQSNASGVVGSFVAERQRATGSTAGLHPVPAVAALGPAVAHAPESRTWPLILAGLLVVTAIVRRHLRKELPE